MKKSLQSLILLLMPMVSIAQDFQFLSDIEAAYENFSEKSISTRRFKHADIEPLLLDLNRKTFDVKVAGESLEGRNIYLVKAGDGPVKVLLWSQMHGDETTATRVLLDLFNFLSEGKPFLKEKKMILDQLTLYFIPMLNPDGAEQFQRRNAMGIDINRDALRLQSPEAQLLKHVRDSLQPDFGFNLHDQNTATSAGNTGNPATLSFLAPAYNEEKETNEVRKKAMQVIVQLNAIAQKYIPGHVGRYDDSFEPRAFGDNIQKWGTSAILIECGGYPGDREKQYIRKVHLLALLGALQGIGNGSYKEADANKYFAIPENSRRHYDLLVKNGQLEQNGTWRTLDLAIRLKESNRPDLSNYDLTGYIDDMGDMSGYYGYAEIEANGMKIKQAKVYPEVFSSAAAVPREKSDEWLKEGYGYLVLENIPDAEFTDLPFNLIKEGDQPDDDISYYSPATFVIEENKKVKYTVVNGMVYNVQTGENRIRNGVVER